MLIDRLHIFYWEINKKPKHSIKNYGNSSLSSVSIKFNHQLIFEIEC